MSVVSLPGMFYPSIMPMDTCNATSRERGRLYICELPLGHDPRVNHQDGDHQWTTQDLRGGPEQIIER